MISDTIKGGGEGVSNFYTGIYRKNILKIFFHKPKLTKTIFVTYSGIKDFLNNSKKNQRLLFMVFIFTDASIVTPDFEDL